MSALPRKKRRHGEGRVDAEVSKRERELAATRELAEEDAIDREFAREAREIDRQRAEEDQLPPLSVILSRSREMRERCSKPLPPYVPEPRDDSPPCPPYCNCIKHEGPWGPRRMAETMHRLGIEGSAKPAEASALKAETIGFESSPADLSDTGEF